MCSSDLADKGDRIRLGIRYVSIYDGVVTAVVVALMLIGAPDLVRWISGSSEAAVLENGARYLLIVSPFYVVLGILIATRCALQGLGQKLLPLVSSVIEFFGKILFVVVFIPRFQYMAVIFCEPVIWCVMTAQLVYTFYHDSYIRSFKKTGR